MEILRSWGRPIRCVSKIVNDHKNSSPMLFFLSHCSIWKYSWSSQTKALANWGHLPNRQPATDFGFVLYKFQIRYYHSYLFSVLAIRELQKIRVCTWAFGPRLGKNYLWYLIFVELPFLQHIYIIRWQYHIRNQRT